LTHHEVRWPSLLTGTSGQLSGGIYVGCWGGASSNWGKKQISEVITGRVPRAGLHVRGRDRKSAANVTTMMPKESGQAIRSEIAANTGVPSGSLSRPKNLDQSGNVPHRS